MAAESIVLTFEIDQEQANKDLSGVEKSLLSLKKQQQDLNKAFKEGKITEDDYIKSNLQLQKAIKTENEQKKTLTKLLSTESNSRNAMRQRVSALNAEYNNLNLTTDKGIKRADELQKELSQLNTELNKGSKAAGQFKDNIGNYPDQLAKATNEVKPFGLSVDGAASSFTKFLNPAGAALGALTGLATLYASSASGAKDLAFATGILSGSFRSATNSFGDFITELTGGDPEGGGILSKVAFAASAAILGLSDATTGVLVANAEKALKELEIINVDAQGIRKLFEKGAEDARRLRDDEEQSLEARLAASKTVESQLLANLQVRQVTQERIIEQLKVIANLSGNDPEIRKEIKQAQAEVRDIQEEINGKLTENIKARTDILQLIEDTNNADRRAASGEQRSSIQGVERQDREDPLEAALVNLELSQEAEVEITERFNQRMAKMQSESADEAIRQKNREAEARIKLERHVQDSTLDIISGFANAAASLFDQQSAEYKALATFQALISTYTTAQKAYEAAFLPIPTVASPALGAAYAALAIVKGLANVALINGVQFAEGGVVLKGRSHAQGGIPIEAEGDEIILTKGVYRNPQLRQMASAINVAGGGIRFADGGVAARAISNPINQAFEISNMLKNMPAPVVGIKEITRGMKAVKVKENISKR